MTNWEDEDLEDWAIGVWAAVEYRGPKAGVNVMRQVLRVIYEEADDD